jgi:lysozyme
MIFVDNGVQGPDVSFYQDDNLTPQQINFNQMVTVGADYVIIRAGQNLWLDPDFKHNWQKAKEAGLPRGSYWFYDSRADPVKQAELFAGLFTDDKPELELWLDLEENYRGAYAGYTHWKKFLVRLKQLIPNARIGIYTNYYYATQIPASEYAFFTQFVLWLAAYTSEPSEAKVPAPWVKCLYWQWGLPPWGLEWGCESKEIDMNLYNGTREEFKSRYGLSGEIPTPEPGEPMSYVELRPNIAGEYRSVRTATNYPAEPHIQGTRIGQINAGSFGEANPNENYTYQGDVVVGGAIQAKQGDKWWKVYKANGVSVSGWVAERHKGITYLTVTQVGDTPPPPDTHVIEIFIDGVLEFRKELP